MKKYFWFLIALFLAMADLYAGSNDDTVWTKNIWPEEAKNVMFSRDSTTPGDSKIFVSTDQRVWILNTLTGDSIRTVSGVGSFLAISPDNRFIYTSNMYKLDAQTFQPIGKFDTSGPKKYSLGNISLTNDGKYLIGVSYKEYTQPNRQDTSFIDYFSTETLKKVNTIKFAGASNLLAYSPDGKYIVTYWGDGIWNSKSNVGKLLLWDAQTFKLIKTIYSDTIRVNSVKFTPNSKFLTVLIYGMIWLYDTNNFKIAKKINTGAWKFNITDESRFFITGNTDTRIWEIQSEKLIYKYNIYDSILGADLACGFNDVTAKKDLKYILSSCSYYITLLNGRFEFLEKKDLTKDNNSIIIYPNPINKIANIYFDNANSGNYILNIYDNSGLKLINIFDDILDIGIHKFIWNTENYPSGNYFCKIIGKDVNLTYKIIVTK